MDVIRFGEFDLIKNHLKNELERYIRNHNSKLGYLKGSKLTIKFPNRHEFNRKRWEDNIYYTGYYSIEKIITSFINQNKNINISYNPSTEVLTIERIKNGKFVLENVILHIEYIYDFHLEERKESCTPSWPDLPDAPDHCSYWWKDRGNESGYNKAASITLEFTQFEEIPKLQVKPKINCEINLDSEVNATDFFNVISSAGEVEAEFINKLYSNSYNPGKHTATIHAWDEYGEEDKNDKEHNLTFDVVVNAVDKSTWKDKNLRDWKFISANQWEIVRDPDNSLTDDHVIYSNDSIKAHKEYSLEKGATYKFTAFIKPDVLSTWDKMALSLIPGRSSSKKREIFSSNSYDLPSIDKGFKEVSKEFTVGDGEENLTFEFFANFRDKGGYIDSFKLERIK
ncbi:hypothetical protein ABNE82_20775 [Paenibacillus larvae]